MRRHDLLAGILAVAFLGIAGGPAAAGREATCLYDTGATSRVPLSAIVLATQIGWTRVPEGQTAHAFQGDCVLMNNGLAVVLRQGRRGAEVHAGGPRDWHQCAALVPLGVARVQRLTSIDIVKNSEDGVCVDALFETTGEQVFGVRYALDKGQCCVRAEPLKDTRKLGLEAPCDFAVLPSATGDDYVIAAEGIQEADADCPGGNFLLHMLGRGETIVMSEWDGPAQDIRVNVGTVESKRMIRSSEIGFSKGGKVWIAVLERRGLWQVQDSAGESGEEALRLHWRWPEPAPWREAGRPPGQRPEWAAETYVGLPRLVSFEATAGKRAGRVEGPFTRLYDTASVSQEPLTGSSFAKAMQWTSVPAEQTDYVFEGDTVLMNDKLAVVLRQGGPGAEVYARGLGIVKLYGTLAPAHEPGTAQPVAVAIVKNAEDEVVVDAFFKRPGEDFGIRYGLAMGRPFVETTPLGNATKLCVKTPCRFAVVPDFFADDIVIDAREVWAERVEVPSENFLLHMLDNGAGLVMSVWERPGQDVRLTLSDAMGTRVIESSEITFGEDAAVWVAVLADPGIWHSRDITTRDKGRELRLDWQWPFPALWRVTWRRSDRLADSWEMLTQMPDGSYKKHGLFEEDEDAWAAQDWWGSGHPRRRITSELGRFNYPCWVDRRGQGYLEPLRENVEFNGPAIIYPLNRLAATPLDKFTVVDVVRATLGVGPCEYILDVEGQEEAFKGLPTCTIQDILDEIYERGQQKARQAEAKQALVDVIAFITLIRRRIDDYVAFGKDMQTYLAAQQKEYPALAAYLMEMEALTREIDRAVARHREGIKTIEYAAELVDEFRRTLLGYDGPDAAQKCKEYTKGWVGIGGNQDKLVAECRVAVKVLRQRAATALAAEPRLGEIVNEVRARTQAILRTPVNYEAPRH